MEVYLIFIGFVPSGTIFFICIGCIEIICVGCEEKLSSNIYFRYFSSAPNLAELYLDHNELTTLDTYVFNDLDKLQILDLSYNKFTQFSEKIFSAVPNLINLNLGYNEQLGKHILKLLENQQTDQLVETTLGIPADLTSLDLSGLDFKSIPEEFFEGMASLKILSLADNGLVHIPDVPYDLVYLDLSGNLMPYLAARDLRYHNLATLKLERLKNLTVIDR